jgi:dynein heavy chain
LEWLANETGWHK